MHKQAAHPQQSGPAPNRLLAPNGLLARNRLLARHVATVATRLPGNQQPADLKLSFEHLDEEEAVGLKSGGTQTGTRTHARTHAPKNRG